MLSSTGGIPGSRRRSVLTVVSGVVLLGGLGAFLHAALPHPGHHGERRCDICTHLDGNPADPAAVAAPLTPGLGSFVPVSAAAAPAGEAGPRPRSRAPPAPDSVS